MAAFKKRPVYMDYLFITIGTAIIAIGLNWVYEPCSLVVGGVSGVSIIIKKWTEGIISGGMPLWLTNLLLNVPIFIAGFVVKGKSFIGKTLYATALLSFWLWLIPVIPVVDGNLFLAAVFGGVIQGVGLGLVFVTQATTGGTDMLGAVIQHYAKHLSIPRVMAVIDAMIIIVGGYVFGLTKAMYAIVSIFVVNKVADAIIEGLKFAKAAYIITDKYQEVADLIMKELDRGVTGIHAKGMYSGKEQDVLFCVLTKKEMVLMKEIVAKVDERAFIIVSDAREVLGEGFLPVE